MTEKVIKSTADLYFAINLWRNHAFAMFCVFSIQSFSLHSNCFISIPQSLDGVLLRYCG